MWEVRLHAGAPREKRVLLRELTGADELAASSGAPAAATRLLAALASQLTGSAGPMSVTALSVSEHDRLLAAIYTRTYGDGVECRAQCRGCGEAFEFAVPLDRVLADQDERAATWGEPDAEGWWSAGGGARFRAPTSAEALVADAGVLAELCLDGEASRDFDFEVALDAAAPTLSIDLDVACPHCGERQWARFDIARHLAAALAGERSLLIREAHLIASTYGWPHIEIMELTRNDRRAYSALITDERSAAAKGLRSRR